MLPEVGGMELLVIAAVALIVVGPKDLPMLLRKLGQFVGRLRAMADDFRASFDEMARQSELDDLRKEVEAMRRGQLADQAAADAHSVEVNQVFSEIENSLSGDGVQFPPPVSQEIAPQPTPIPAAKPRAPRAPKAAGAKSAAAKTPAAKAAAKPKAAASKKPPAARPAKGTVS